MMRKGMSYLEVLIAAGVALTGILGAIAIYPVAILNLRKGQTADVAAAIGPSVLNSVGALHVNQPDWWLASVGGSLVEVQNQNYPSRADFQGRNIHPAIQPFDALCFDPRFVASVTTWDATQSDPTLFPAMLPANALDARMRRVTLAANLPGLPGPKFPLSIAQSRLCWKAQDDLLFERPTQSQTNRIPDPPPLGLPVTNDRDIDVERESPAVQFYADNGKTQRRDYFADFEFVITAVPKTEFSGGVFIATGDYDLSAVVFRERSPDLEKIVTYGGDASFIEDERLCDVAFLTPGYSGGDVTATLRPGRPASDLNLVQSSWALVSGVETVTDNRTAPPLVGQRPVFQWYRVVSFSEVYGNQRDLTLDGPDWPANTSNLRITFVSGVSAVFTERMQLQ